MKEWNRGLGLLFTSAAVVVICLTASVRWWKFRACKSCNDSVVHYSRQDSYSRYCHVCRPVAIKRDREDDWLASHRYESLLAMDHRMNCDAGCMYEATIKSKNGHRMTWTSGCAPLVTCAGERQLREKNLKKKWKEDQHEKVEELQVIEWKHLEDTENISMEVE